MFDQYNKHRNINKLSLALKSYKISLISIACTLVMGLLSKTGLLASATKAVKRYREKQDVELPALIQPAPFITKPLAGIQNPYPNGCSLLCNHPTGSTENKRPNKIKQQIIEPKPTQTLTTDSNLQLIPPQSYASVPEVLFRKYAETDSRPLTPTPSAITTATTTCINRRCLTPQPQQRPKLIVDLRRTHSQETLSWTVYSEPGPTEMSDGETSAESTHSVVVVSARKSAKKVKSPKVAKTPREEKELDVKSPMEPVVENLDSEKESDDDEDVPRRRGRKRKARSRVGTAIKTADNDPETQVASIQMDLENSDEENNIERKATSAKKDKETTIHSDNKILGASQKRIMESFLDPELIEILQRQLTQETIDMEFDEKKKIALQEAQRCMDPKDVKIASEKIDDFDVDRELWLKLPRNYAITNSRFELPLDIQEFEELTPLKYLEKYVIVTENRLLLTNYIFKRFQRTDTPGRWIQGKEISSGLGELMGRPLSEAQALYIRGLVRWDDLELYNFRLWSSICALCERLFGTEYWPTNPIDDSGNEVEKVDFETLPRKINGLDVNPMLRELLLKIRNG